LSIFGKNNSTSWKRITLFEQPIVNIEVMSRLEEVFSMKMVIK